MQKKYATGRPDQKDLNENLAATQGLAHMITECNRLFEVSLSLSLSLMALMCLDVARSLTIVVLKGTGFE